MKYEDSKRFNNVNVVEYIIQNDTSHTKKVNFSLDFQGEGFQKINEGITIHILTGYRHPNCLRFLFQFV